jgi:hypothetical protein
MGGSPREYRLPREYMMVIERQSSMGEGGGQGENRG